MATYYHYSKDGALQSSSSSSNPLANLGSACAAASHYLQCGDVVGAYLARRQMIHAATNNTGSYHESLQEAAYGQHPGTQNAVQQAGPQAANIEEIRHLHTLQSLLAHINPERRLNTSDSPTIDIVEAETGVVFARDVSKKMLVLFFGKAKVRQFLQTIDVRIDDRFRDHRRIQRLCIPARVASVAAFKIILSWMLRACDFKHISHVRQFTVPQNTFSACTLAQTLELFGLHKDALRCDMTIANEHFVRPISAAELETLWNCLGPHNRYTLLSLTLSP
jgi:hypothetical protein